MARPPRPRAARRWIVINRAIQLLRVCAAKTQFFARASTMVNRRIPRLDTGRNRTILDAAHPMLSEHRPPHFARGRFSFRDIRPLTEIALKKPSPLAGRGPPCDSGAVAARAVLSARLAREAGEGAHFRFETRFHLPQRGEVDPPARASARRIGWGECLSHQHRHPPHAPA
jgi:hypothetical protein